MGVMHSCFHPGFHLVNAQSCCLENVALTCDTIYKEKCLKFDTIILAVLEYTEFSLSALIIDSNMSFFKVFLDMVIEFNVLCNFIKVLVEYLATASGS